MRRALINDRSAPSEATVLLDAAVQAFSPVLRSVLTFTIVIYRMFASVVCPQLA